MDKIQTELASLTMVEMKKRDLKVCILVGDNHLNGLHGLNGNLIRRWQPFKMISFYTWSRLFVAETNIAMFIQLIEGSPSRPNSPLGISCRIYNFMRDPSNLYDLTVQFVNRMTEKDIFLIFWIVDYHMCPYTSFFTRKGIR